MIEKLDPDFLMFRAIRPDGTFGFWLYVRIGTHVEPSSSLRSATPDPYVPPPAQPGAGAADYRHTGEQDQHQHIPHRPRAHRRRKIQRVQSDMQPSVPPAVAIDDFARRRGDWIQVVAGLVFVIQDETAHRERLGDARATVVVPVSCSEGFCPP